MKKILFGVICAVTLTACGNKKNQVDLSSTENDAIVVYYSSQNPFYQAALESYQKKGNTLDLHAFETDEELAKQYAAEGLSANGADVLLLGNTTSFDIKKLAEENTCLDLTEYMMQDTAYQLNNYFEIVVDAGKVEEKQYILPFTYDLGLTVVREAVDDMCGNILTDNTNCYEFYNKLLTCQQILYDSEEIRLGLCMFSNSVEEFLLYIYHTSGLNLTDGFQVTADKEHIQALCDFVKAGQTEFLEKYEEMKNAGRNSGMLVGYQFLYGNPAAIVRKQEFSYEASFEEAIHYYMFPEETAGGYHATIHDFGFVSAKSKCPEASYQLLRYLMDYDSYQLGIVYDTGVPIYRKNFESQFKKLSEITKITIGNQSKKVSAMSETHYQKLEEQMKQIVSARFLQPDVERIFAETMTDYVNGKSDFDTCYQQMCSRLELYLKE